MTTMSTTSDRTTPITPETKAHLADKVDSAVDSAQVKLDAAIDAAQEKAAGARATTSEKAAGAREHAKERAMDALDATQAGVDRAVGKAKDALQK
jgi:hypothetical protein